MRPLYCINGYLVPKLLAPDISCREPLYPLMAAVWYEVRIIVKLCCMTARKMADLSDGETWIPAD